MRKTLISALVVVALMAQLTGCSGNTTVEQSGESTSVVSEVGEPQSSSSEQTSSPIYETNENDFEYDTAEGGIKITKYLGNGGYVKIPDTIDGKTVVEINSDAFDGCVGLIGIFIPAKLTTISFFGRSYLKDCINLESIKVADDNPTYYSFDDVLYEKKEDGLRMMICPVAKKGTLKIPSSATQIGFSWGPDVFDTFEECEYIESINVAEGNPNFCSIDGLLCKKEDDGNITLVIYPKLKGSEIVIPDGVTVVENIFSDRSDITSISIGSDVKQFITPVIGNSLHEGAPSILYSQSFLAFDFTKVTKISVSENNKTFFCTDKMLCENRENGEVELLECLNTASGKITIPNGVTHIGTSSFGSCNSLTDVTIPNSVHTIGSYAFVNCSELKSVNIPESVSTIGWSAFGDCKNLSSVTIPDSVTYIGEDAFAGCDNITVTYKGKTYTKSNMSDLHSAANSASQPSNTASSTTSEQTEPIAEYAPETDFGCAFVGDGAEIRTYEGNGGNVIIPETISGESVVMISGRTTNHEGFVGAFKNNTAVTSITVPDTVRGFGGVDGCTNLESINVGEGNPYLAGVDGMLCRKTDNGLMLILCPEGKKGKVVIPDSVTEIAEGAFNGCGGISEIVVGNGVTRVNTKILSGCENLKHLTLGNGISRFGRNTYLAIEESDDTLENFTSLESVVFGDGLTRLGDCAFDGCTSLKSVTLGNGLTFIANYVFKGFPNITVTFKGKTYTQDNMDDLYNLFMQ